MKQLKFRIPVICQNGHKALFHYEIKNRDLGDICEFRSIGVPDNQDCSCSKGALDEGWRRQGNDQMCLGLEDVDGKVFFEGDIFTLDYSIWKKKNAFLIVFLDDEACFVALDAKGNSIEVSNFSLSKSKIIGNSYLNPELLMKG